MSLLRERLLRHKRQEIIVDRKTASDSEGFSDSPYEGEKKNDEAAKVNEWEVVGAVMEQNEWGSFILRRRIFEPGNRHGHYRLSDLAGEADGLHRLFDSGACSTISETGEDCLHEKLLFLDTETTGLGVGAGNVPFMIGIGFYREREFVVEQMVIRHPGEEIAMLNYLQDKVKKHPVVISYNGKSFDWPIVKNRYIMNRLSLEAEPEGHIDFLYPSRSLWKHTLPSCRLGKVEEERLGVCRENDVPGALAPALYFQYLAERDPAILEGVFVHNELDVLSLAGLAVHFSGLLAGRINWQDVCAYGIEEWYRLGLWLDKIGMHARAEQAMDALFDELHSIYSGESNADEAGSCVLPLAQYFKRQGKYARACALWKLYIERKGGRSTASLEPYIELSMYYEHKEKQYEQALMYAEQGMDILRQRGALIRRTEKKGHGWEEAGGPIADGKKNESAELEKRIARLKKKAAS